MKVSPLAFPEIVKVAIYGAASGKKMEEMAVLIIIVEGLSLRKFKVLQQCFHVKYITGIVCAVHALCKFGLL